MTSREGLYLLSGRRGAQAVVAWRQGPSITSIRGGQGLSIMSIIYLAWVGAGKQPHVSGGGKSSLTARGTLY